MSDSNKVIIGIDFGSSGISFAYGFKSDQNKNVIQGHFEDQIKNSKISAEIILDNNLKEVLAFGTKCESYISHNEPNTYHHFKQIKMNLYKKNYKIKSNNQQKEVDIEYIIRLILIEVKKNTIMEIKKTKPSIIEKDCIFVISVPAIWDLKSKQIMLQASQNAGLFEENEDTSTFFSLEPEAASIYYNTELSNYQDVIEPGCGFILCDLGGGTADIIAQKKVMINNKIYFDELHPPTGGSYGIQNINDNFIERVIKKLFGEQNVNKLLENIKDDYLEWVKFENEVELFKKSYNFTFIDNNIKYYCINCEIFQNCFDGKINIEDLVNNFNQNRPENLKIRIKRRWNIEFPYKIMDDLMEELLEGVVNYIKEISNNPNIKIQSLIFTGGGSLNPSITSKIEKKTASYLNYIKSHNPETAISMGSVKWAYDKNIISKRIAKFTFGVAKSLEWNEELHKNGGKKIFNTLTNKYDCDNLFDKFITKGEEIPSNKVITKYFLMDSPSIIIDLYKTEKENVTFCDEKENGKNVTQKFGELYIEVKDGFDPFENSVGVDMKMGGTFISMSAIFVKTGKKASTICIFDDKEDKKV